MPAMQCDTEMPAGVGITQALVWRLGRRCLSKKEYLHAVKLNDAQSPNGLVNMGQLPHSEEKPPCRLSTFCSYSLIEDK